MVLSPHEERVAADIESELRERDASWSRHADALVAQLDRQRVVRPSLPIACLLAAVAFVFASSQEWLATQLAILMGLPASLVHRTFTVGACTMVIAAALLAARAAYERRRRVAPRD